MMENAVISNMDLIKIKYEMEIDSLKEDLEYTKIMYRAVQHKNYLLSNELERERKKVARLEKQRQLKYEYFKAENQCKKKPEHPN